MFPLCNPDSWVTPDLPPPLPPPFNSRPFTADAGVHSQAGPYGICTGQSAIVVGFSRNILFTLSISSHQCSILVCSSTDATKSQHLTSLSDTIKKENVANTQKCIRLSITSRDIN